MAFLSRYYRKNPSRLKRRRSRRGRSSRRTKTSFKTRVTQVLMKKAETKYYDIAEENVQLYHNNGTSTTLLSNPGSLQTIFNPWADIPVGTGRNQRIGDRIIPRGMSLKIWFANKSDRPNVMYRVIILRCPKVVTGSTTSYNNLYPFQTADLGSNGNQMIMPLDKDRGFKAFYDKTFNLQLGNSSSEVPILGYVGKECHMVKKFWIKSKGRAIQYDPGAGAGVLYSIVNNPLLVYVIPYDSFGTPKTDNIATCAYQARLYYKDF